MPRDEQSIYVYIIKALILLKSALLFFTSRTLSFSLSYLRPRALFVVVPACGLVGGKMSTFFGAPKKVQTLNSKKARRKKWIEKSNVVSLHFQARYTRGCCSLHPRRRRRRRRRRKRLGVLLLLLLFVLLLVIIATAAAVVDDELLLLAFVVKSRHRYPRPKFF